MKEKYTDKNGKYIPDRVEVLLKQFYFPGTITSINDNKSNNTMATSKSKTLKSLYEIDGITIICFPLTPKPLEVRHQYAWIDNYFNNDKDSVENKNIVRDLMKEEID